MDEHPLQDGVTHQATALTSNHPQFSMVGLREMVVVDVLYKDQANNRSQAIPEYTCRDLMTNEFVYGVRRLTLTGDPNNGDDAPLHPAKNLLPGAKPQRFTKSTPAKSTDGTRVLVGFVEGSQHRPVIVGVLTHPKATYGASAADGERRLIMHQGSSLEFKQDGTVIITQKSGSVARMNTSGDIITTPASGRSLFHGDEGCTENHLLGQQWKAMMSSLIDALLAATYPTGVGPTGPMLPPSQTTLQTIKASLDTILSQMAFTQRVKL